MQQPEVIVRAAAGTQLEGKLTLAEAAGIKAIFSEIKQVQHRRRELMMQDQKEAATEETTIEALDEAWRELCEVHDFDPNVPISAWTISKKNRAMLNRENHPGLALINKPARKKDDTDAGATSDEPSPDGLPGAGRTEPGGPGAAHPGGGDADRGEPGSE